MNAMPDRAAFALRKAGPPTPLLAFLAGDHAHGLARLWPAPHEAFLTLPTPRRHAAAILLAGLGRQTPPDGAALVRWVSRDKDGVLARRLAGELSAGLIKALGKAGEQLWTRADYARLLDLFAEPLANRALRHMVSVSPASLAPLGALPAPLREAKILAALPCLHAANDLALAFALIGRMTGEAGQRKAIKAWPRAGDTGALMAMASSALVPDVFRPPAPAPELGLPFDRVRTMEQLVRVALDFRNCLRDFAADVANGRMAVYDWRGTPNAAIALTWDAAGWRLAEAEAADNEPLAEAPLRSIVGALDAAGVRTGPSLRNLSERLQRHVHGHGEIIGPGFVEALELGDLWA